MGYKAEKAKKSFFYFCIKIIFLLFAQYCCNYANFPSVGLMKDFQIYVIFFYWFFFLFLFLTLLHIIFYRNLTSYGQVNAFPPSLCLHGSSHLKCYVFVSQLEALNIPYTVQSFLSSPKEALVKGLWKKQSHEPQVSRYLAAFRGPKATLWSLWPLWPCRPCAWWQTSVWSTGCTTPSCGIVSCRSCWPSTWWAAHTS